MGVVSPFLLPYSGLFSRFAANINFYSNDHTSTPHPYSTFNTEVNHDFQVFEALNFRGSRSICENREQ